MKRLNAFIILTVCFGFSIVGCNSGENQLESTLKEAGSNRKQLEEVLQHYKKSTKDSLKYKAALFLINNIENKFYYSGDQYEDFVNFIDSISLTSLSVEEYKNLIDSFYHEKNTLVGNLEKVYDIKYIKADYLIENIDLAFIAYENAPWKKDVSFKTFCEYILPYRVSNEPLANLRGYFYSKYKNLIQDSLSMQNAADTILKRLSEKKLDIITFPDFVPGFPISSLLNIKGGTCKEASDLGIYILRSLGFPVAEDFTPQWPHRGMGHSWCALLINDDSCIDFEGTTSEKVGGHLRLSNSNRMAKAYRNTFGRNLNSLAVLDDSEPIPQFFQNANIQDVSSYYFKGSDIQLPVPNSITNKYLYLCVFNNRSWIPIQWSERDNNVIVFPQMGKPSVYLPAYYNGTEIKSISNPILVDSNYKTNQLNPNNKILQTIILKRKYPVFDWWNTRTALLKGGRFEASNDSNFKNTVLIYEIDEIPDMTYQDIAINQEKAYKYWRFKSADSSYGDLAELIFFDNANKVVNGKIIGTKVMTGHDKENVFDGKPLTYFQGDEPNGNWVGMAFSKPTSIHRIKYLPRNDGNFIEKDDSYQLFYWNNGTWNLLGNRIGDTSQVLIFKDVPTNSLFLLHDETKGREERIFTYENGKLSWW